MDIKPRQTRDISRQRSQFQSSYYYAPSRPVSSSSTATPAPAPTYQDFQPRRTSLAKEAEPTPPPRVERPEPVEAASYHEPTDFYDEIPQRPVKKRSTRFAPALVFVAVLLCSLGVGTKIIRAHQAKPDAQARTEQKSTTNTAAVNQIEDTSKNATPAPVVTTGEEMGAAINAVIAANKNINTSVSIIDLKSGETFNYGVDAVFDAASTGKVVSAVDYLKQVEAGSESLDKTLGDKKASDQLKNMIEVSDNTAWNAINNELTHSALQTFAQGLGMSTYTADNNRMKPKDLATLEAQVYQGKVLNDANKKILFDHMKNADKAEFFLSALPSGINIYHKAGWLDDRSHDSAIVDNGTNPYVVVAYTKGKDGGDETQRISILHKVANATVAHFISKDTAAQLSAQ